MVNVVADYEFEAFSSRKSFNRNLKHFKSVNAIVEAVQSGTNLADFLQEKLQAGELEANQLSPLVLALLVEKYNYAPKSFNLKQSTSNLTTLQQDFIQWNAVDLVLTYHHPESGLLVINPKNPAHWQLVGELRKNELVTVYAGFGVKPEKGSASIAKAALERGQKLVNGEKGKTGSTLLSGPFVWKVAKVKAAAAPKTAKSPVATKTKGEKAKIGLVTLAPQASAQPVAAPVVQNRQVTTVSGRMIVSPKIPIQVTNELFHNGNVEAWKRVIESYSSKYPAYRVTIYYDGEIIHDINSLFKWGKVKHGTAILFSVAGPDEKLADLSKLRKYLLEGASPRFEVFLRGAPGKTLELF